MEGRSAESNLAPDLELIPRVQDQDLAVGRIAVPDFGLHFMLAPIQRPDLEQRSIGRPTPFSTGNLGHALEVPPSPPVRKASASSSVSVIDRGAERHVNQSFQEAARSVMVRMV